MRALPINKTAGPGGRPRDSRAPRNAFADWLASSKMTSAKIAEALEVGISTVYNLRNSYFLPGLSLAVKIEELSKGRVKVASWDDVQVRPRKKKAA